MQRYIERVENWFSAPYRQDGNAVDWFLFFGLAAIAGYIWAQAIKRVF